MGTDIHGFVECRASHGMPPDEEDGWSAAIDLELLYAGRDYDAFGCLFGVRDLANFAPLAAGRGLPDDLAGPTRAAHAAWRSDAMGETWIGWAEVEAVDWDEPSADVDDRIHECRIDADGRWMPYAKAAWSRDFARLAGLPERPDPGYGGRRWPEGTEWRDGEVGFRVVRLRRREAAGPDGEWGPVWAVMRALAEVHGKENVRLVVWFD
ncbi:hypothetical protein ACIRBX_03375 [Kitasatospora sp. NPDC096147]|uniref:hypothetical protein n=1 Tax=Kitasatospora sp. NPDC096147 TaxID=3364093 RepID=UPI00381D16AD